MDTINKVVDGIKNVTISGEGSSEQPQQQQQQQPKKEKVDKKAKKAAADAEAGPLEMTPPPEYIQHRIDLFEKLKAEYDAEVAQKPREDIKITMPDGSIKVGKSWETTPESIAKGISKSLLEKVSTALVDGKAWDMARPLEADCTLELVGFEHPEGRRVFWHSSAHVLGEAAERRFGCHLCLGPPTEEGFFYEMGMSDRVVLPTDYKPLETIATKAIKEKQVFERLVVSKENLLEMFKHNQYKQHLIKTKVPDGTGTTVYRCGPLIDLCVGPHIPNTGRIKAFQVLKNSSCYFLGDAENDTLQRIYGISFPDKKQMDEYKKFVEEAAKRDHRKIGKEQELFFFHELSPGSPFVLPNGTKILNNLFKFMREEYWTRGYDEVQTPNMYNVDLWKTSGHYQNYGENMFKLEIERQEFALKPMNCPGHCLMFGHRDRSHRDLPWRVADFGVLHRNEASGALTGLTRVRKFQQDDAHIFCTQAQIQSEIKGIFDLLQKVYGIFGFTFKLRLSTRPEKFLGEIATWDKAEAQLTEALDWFTAQGNAAWELNPEDGAFYGPKIDITISDALRREHQCATIQLDFQLPEKFKLEYNTGEAAVKKEDGKDAINHYARPVMIHRAIFGSLERFFAILIEHYAGKWPFWLSPRQVMVIPVMVSANDYVEEIQQLFRAEGLHCDIDIGANTMAKKIREAQLKQYNFIIVVGAQEKETRSLNIRNRDDKATQAKGELIPLDEALAKMITLNKERRSDNVLA